MGPEIIYQFLLESSEGIFDRPKNVVWRKQVGRSFRQNVCSILTCLKILDESKTVGDDHNCMPFLNMNSEMLSLFLFESTKESFERPENWFARRTNRFLLTPIHPFVRVLQIVRLGDL